MTATAIKERPILMNAEMVRAALADRKTQTRRIVKQLQDSQERVFKYAHGEVWASLKPEEIAPNNADPPESIFGGRAMFDGERCYSPAVVGKGPAGKGKPLLCPYGQPGDRLWVRESWRKVESGLNAGKADYRADDPAASGTGFLPWTPSIHMPRWASRITLEIVGLKVERLQEITPLDAIAEGCCPEGENEWDKPEVYREAARLVGGPYPRGVFAMVWNSIYGADAWDRNDWVWAIEFKRLEQA